MTARPTAILTARPTAGWEPGNLTDMELHPSICFSTFGDDIGDIEKFSELATENFLYVPLPD